MNFARNFVAPLFALAPIAAGCTADAAGTSDPATASDDLSGATIVAVAPASGGTVRKTVTFSQTLYANEVSQGGWNHASTIRGRYLRLDNPTDGTLHVQIHRGVELEGTDELFLQMVSAEFPNRFIPDAPSDALRATSDINFHVERDLTVEPHRSAYVAIGAYSYLPQTTSRGTPIDATTPMTFVIETLDALPGPSNDTIEFAAPALGQAATKEAFISHSTGFQYASDNTVFAPAASRYVHLTNPRNEAVHAVLSAGNTGRCIFPMYTTGKFPADLNGANPDLLPWPYEAGRADVSLAPGAEVWTLVVCGGDVSRAELSFTTEDVAPGLDQVVDVSLVATKVDVPVLVSPLVLRPALSPYHEAVVDTPASYVTLENHDAVALTFRATTNGALLAAYDAAPANASAATEETSERPILVTIPPGGKKVLQVAYGAGARFPGAKATVTLERR